MNRKELESFFNSREIYYTSEQYDQLDELMKSTLLTNEKFNLTAITDPSSFYEKMILDSALTLQSLNFEGKSIIDVGTGAGFPGLVLKILSPSTKVTLLDSTAKKINYLNEYSKSNGLNVEPICARAEEYSKINREKYDIGVARAVSALKVLVEIIIPTIKVGGYLVALKGMSYEDELNEASSIMKKLGCHLEHIYSETLPESKEERLILCIKKDKVTSNKYPRQYKEIIGSK